MRDPDWAVGGSKLGRKAWSPVIDGPKCQVWLQEVAEDFWVEQSRDHICALAFLDTRASFAGEGVSAEG